MDFKQYINQIANGLQNILTARITVEKQLSFKCNEDLWIEIRYKHKTYALTPYFCREQFRKKKTIDEAVINGFESLKEEVVKDFGIGQLVDFQKR